MHIDQINSRSQHAIMYLDKLRNTDIEYSRKVEIDQFMFFFVSHVMTVVNQCIIRHPL
jgi:hypothetical protein